MYSDGFDEGFDEGFDKGFDKGIGEGVDKGINKMAIKVIKSALAMDMKVEQISKLTSLSIEEVKKIITVVQKYEEKYEKKNIKNGTIFCKLRLTRIKRCCNL